MKLKKKAIYTFALLFLFLVGATVVLYQKWEAAATAEDALNARVVTLNKDIDRLQSQVHELQEYKNNQENRIQLMKFLSRTTQAKYPQFSDIAKVVFKKSKKYGFNPYLVMGIIQVESNFDTFAVSHAGAYGLMQVNFRVWKEVFDIDFSRIFEYEYNIDLGLKILHRYYKKAAGNILVALFRYNNGYRHNNTAYPGKVESTSFYAQQKHAEEDARLAQEISI